MNRIVRVFQNSWPGLRSQPIQRHRPAAKKKTGTVAVVIVLSAADHSNYKVDAFGANQTYALRVRRENADWYWLFAMDRQKLEDGWPSYYPFDGDWSVHYQDIDNPSSHYYQEYDDKLEWDDTASVRWHELRERLAEDFGYKYEYDNGETKHQVPIYVLWQKGYSVRYRPPIYNEAAIEAEWRAKVDAFADDYHLYMHRYNRFTDYGLRSLQYCKTVFFARWNPYYTYSHYHPAPEGEGEDDDNPEGLWKDLGDPMWMCERSWSGSEDHQYGPYGQDSYRYPSGEEPPAPSHVEYFWDEQGSPPIVKAGVYWIDFDKNMLHRHMQEYEYIRKKHKIRDESWELREHVWGPPKQCFWDTSDPNYPEGKWSANEDSPDAWGDDYNCWDIEIGPADVTAVLEYKAYKDNRDYVEYVNPFAVRFEYGAHRLNPDNVPLEDCIANGYQPIYLGNYAAVGIQLPADVSQVDDWYGALGFEGDVDFFGNTTYSRSASGAPKRTNNIVLHIDDGTLPDHVRAGYEDFKQSIDLDNRGNLRVLCSTTPEGLYGIGGGTWSTPFYAEEAHIPLTLIFPRITSGELYLDYDPYKSFLAVRSEEDSPWLDYPSTTDPLYWFTSSDAADEFSMLFG